MYSPTTRLLTVLSLLQSHQQITGAEIARRLEVDIRTVRRYITSLQDMGIPVEGERGPHGAYHLGRGSRMPPLMFTDEEAVVLTLGLLAIREYRFPVDGTAVEGALAKTERTLPNNLLQQVRGLQEAITFNVSSYGAPPPTLPDNGLVIALSSAVQARRRVQLCYRSWRDEVTERDFDPYGIVYNEGYWYTAGYCHLRNDLRTFRLDRVVSINVVPGSFERPATFAPLDYVLESVARGAGTYEVEVLLQTTLEHAQRAVSTFLGRLEPAPEGVILRRSSGQLEWVAYSLMSLDFPVQVKQPEELRIILRQMAAKALQIADGGA